MLSSCDATLHRLSSGYLEMKSECMLHGRGTGYDLITKVHLEPLSLSVFVLQASTVCMRMRISIRVWDQIDTTRAT